MLSWAMSSTSSDFRCSAHEDLIREVGAADVAGRADATSATPPAAPTHFEEIGHCLQTISGGTDVLCRVVLHFN